MKRGTKTDSADNGRDLLELPAGKLKYPLTNDFMFKAVLQRNQTALKGLLCALLQMKMEEIVEIRILNPIEIGSMIDEKMMMLDLKAELNDSRILDVEMQVLDEGNWPERSLAYLCRTFDQLEKGEKYLDYFFYNLDTAHKYSDKVSIRVLQLNQLDNEANEEIWPELYHWARLFKTQTWEEMRMLAEKNETIRECVVTLKELTADEKARMQSEAREDYYRRLNWAEERGLRKGIEQGIEQGLVQGLERGQKEISRILVSNVEHAMENFHVDLETACKGLGTTVEAYWEAKKMLE